MICPLCGLPTRRLIYRRTYKLCPDCADPNRIREMKFIPLAPSLPAWATAGIESFYREQYGYEFPKPQP